MLISSNFSHLKEISPEYSLEGLILKVQYFGHLIRRTVPLKKTLNAGKDWRREEKATTEDAMVGWHHQRDRHEFEQGPGVGDGQWSLACCSPWGHKEPDQLSNSTDWSSPLKSLRRLHSISSNSAHNGKKQNPPATVLALLSEASLPTFYLCPELLDSLRVQVKETQVGQGSFSMGISHRFL